MLDLPVQLEMCPTCPFRPKSKFAFLRDALLESALNESSRICHSTGSNALGDTGKPERFCRGARDVQLEVFHGIGVIAAPTDEAWAAARAAIKEPA